MDTNFHLTKVQTLNIGAQLSESIEPVEDDDVDGDNTLTAQKSARSPLEFHDLPEDNEFDSSNVKLKDRHRPAIITSLDFKENDIEILDIGKVPDDEQNKSKVKSTSKMAHLKLNEEEYEKMNMTDAWNYLWAEIKLQVAEHEAKAKESLVLRRSNL